VLLWRFQIKKSAVSRTRLPSDQRHSSCNPTSGTDSIGRERCSS